MINSCDTCKLHNNDGTCNEVFGDNYGHTTEIGGIFCCNNYVKKGIMTNDEMLQKMFELQDELNIRIKGPDWRDLNLNWNRAIWTECAELIESMDWKWWAKTDENVYNQHVELVDIWHFGMSNLLQRGENFVPYEPSSFGSNSKFGLIENIAIISLANGDFPSPLFFKLCEDLNLSLPNLYKLYMGKQILNKFRQDHGYNNKTYKKIWNINGELPKEDNLFMYDIVFTIDPEMIQYKLYPRLERLYKISK